MQAGVKLFSERINHNSISCVDAIELREFQKSLYFPSKNNVIIMIVVSAQTIIRDSDYLNIHRHLSLQMVTSDGKLQRGLLYRNYLLAMLNIA